MRSANKDYNIILKKNGIYKPLGDTRWMLLDAGCCACVQDLDGNNLLFIQSLREGWLYYVASLFIYAMTCCMNFMYEFQNFQFLKSYFENDYIMFLNEWELSSLVGAK